MSEPLPRTEHWAPNPDPTSIVVPGVDATASVNDQIDQIDQLITIRLQNIDANFSRIQHIISTKLLPAFKRYAEGTEPVREAAKFWKSFYEAAAQVRIPIANDTSSLYHTDDDDSGRDITAESDSGDITPVNVNPQDDSFARGAPISSTPLVRDPTNVALPRDTEDEDSWAASIESPFERLGRGVKDLTLGEQNPEDPSSSSAPSFSPMHGNYPDIVHHSRSSRAAQPSAQSAPTPQVSHPRRKGNSPLRKNVLRQNAAVAAASDTTSTPPRPLHTPRRIKTPKNPFFPPNSASRKWNGLVDLRNPSPPKSRAPRGPRTPEQSTSNKDVSYDSDSSDDLFPPGMSPPVTMQFAMPSRVQRSTGKLALTPARRAAERIGRDLVANAAGRGMDAGSSKRPFTSAQTGGGDPSLSSVAPSLPSLTRYSGRAPAGALAMTSALEPPRLQVEGHIMTPVHQIYRPYSGAETFAQVPDPRHIQEDVAPHIPDPRRLIVDEGTAPSPVSDSDSESSEHDESNPSAAFIFATQNNARANADDSFASSQQSMSSDEDDDDAARAARHPLAHIFVTDPDQAVGADDSFDQDDSFANVPAEEETVFGARQVGQAPGEGRLRIMRDALLDDTYPGAPSLNPFAQVEQSPTPYVGDATDLR